jgi:hypothetical protein
MVIRGLLWQWRLISMQSLPQHQSDNHLITATTAVWLPCNDCHNSSLITMQWLPQQQSDYHAITATTAVWLPYNHYCCCGSDCMVIRVLLWQWLYGYQGVVVAVIKWLSGGCCGSDHMVIRGLLWQWSYGYQGVVVVVITWLSGGCCGSDHMHQGVVVAMIQWWVIHLYYCSI